MVKWCNLRSDFTSELVAAPLSADSWRKVCARFFFANRNKRAGERAGVDRLALSRDLIRVLILSRSAPGRIKVEDVIRVGCISDRGGD